MFRHIGLCGISGSTYFSHQRKFLFPSILMYWEKYQCSLLASIKSQQDCTFSGDGRYDSMGHSAKYGTYTMYCNTISKIVHFEILQVS